MLMQVVLEMDALHMVSIAASNILIAACCKARHLR